MIGQYKTKHTVYTKCTMLPHFGFIIIINMRCKSKLGLVSIVKWKMITIKLMCYVWLFRYGMLPPVYINVVRDPIERLKSHYYYHIFGSYSDNPTNLSTYDNMVSTLLSSHGRYFISRYHYCYQTLCNIKHLVYHII